MTPQGKEFTSLLFTPRTADKPNQPDYRSSRPARSPTSGRVSAGGYGRMSSFRDSAGPGYGGYGTAGNIGGSPGYGPQVATPATGGYGGGLPRRRSLTPSGSLKETVAPPSGSMFESPTGAGPAFAQGSAGVSFSGWIPPPSASAIAGADGGVPSAPAQSALSVVPQKQVQQLQVYSEEPKDITWVTVFGFQPSDETVIMQEFMRCGDILHFGSGREDRVNWVHIQYANKFQAQRALAKNGELLSGRLMVGVKPTETRDQLATSTTETSSEGELRRASKPLPSRPYLVPAPGSESLLAQPAENTWTKISQYVFGL